MDNFPLSGTKGFGKIMNSRREFLIDFWIFFCHGNSRNLRVIKIYRYLKKRK